MNQDKFERMMAKWVEEEKQTMPELRPTREMYQKVKAKRQGFLLPFFSRWATIGVAAIALVVSILVLRPQVFQSFKEADLIAEKKQISEELPQGEALREDRPSPADPPASEAPLQQRKKAVLEAEGSASETQEMAVLDLGSSVSGAKDNVASLAKKEDARKEGFALTDKQFVSPGVPDKAPKTASAPEPLRRTVRSRTILHEAAELDDELDMKNAEPQAAFAPEKRKGMLLQPPGPAGDREQEESNVGILSVPGRDSDDAASKAFDLHEGVWIDREHRPENILIRIERDSSAYRDLLAAKPDLQMYSDRYYHIIINLGTHSIEISDSGKSELSQDELDSLLK